MSRKGQFDIARKTIYWTISGFVLTIVLLAYVIIITSHSTRLTNVPEDLRADMIALRFTNIAECFAYEEDGLVNPGVVDLSKFTKEQMQICYKTDPDRGQKDLNFRLTLRDKEVITNNYFNVDDFTIRRRVFVHTDQGLEEDVLTIFVQGKI